MGYGADQTKRSGTFYLKTNSKAPFCGKFASGFSIAFLVVLVFPVCCFFHVLCVVFVQLDHDLL